MTQGYNSQRFKGLGLGAFEHWSLGVRGLGFKGLGLQVRAEDSHRREVS